VYNSFASDCTAWVIYPTIAMQYYLTVIHYFVGYKPARWNTARAPEPLPIAAPVKSESGSTAIHISKPQ
jgi:hypothetical protein